MKLGVSSKHDLLGEELLSGNALKSECQTFVW